MAQESRMPSLQAQRPEFKPQYQQQQQQQQQQNIYIYLYLYQTLKP
jgi:hypothetical protein